MILEIAPNVLAELEIAHNAASPYEYSGIGWIEPHNDLDGFYLYDWRLLDVGGPTSTIITPNDTAINWPNKKNLKVWIHTHPMGDGKPGLHNWSTIDEHAIRNTPLGTIPLLAEWSVSLVRTPGGWVARMDTYNTAKPTTHMRVLPASTNNLIQRVENWKPEPEGFWQRLFGGL